MFSFDYATIFNDNSCSVSACLEYLLLGSFGILFGHYDVNWLKIRLLYFGGGIFNPPRDSLHQQRCG